MKNNRFLVLATVLLIVLAFYPESYAQRPTVPSEEIPIEEILVDPNSNTLNPFVFDLDDEAPDMPESPKNDIQTLPQADVQADKELLRQIPVATRAQFTKNILPAIRAGSSRDFLAAMEQLVSRQSPAAIEALEKYSVASGLGSLRELFTEVLLEAVEQRLPVNASKLHPVFAQYAASALVDVIESELHLIADHTIMQDPLEQPVDWRDSDELFWEVHVWKNRFLNLDQLVRYTIAIQQPMLDRAIKKNSQDDIDRLLQPTRLADEIKTVYAEMLERETELRMLELAKAETVLRTDQDFEQRLHAAFALEMHAGELEIFFASNEPGTFRRRMLNDQMEIDKASALLKSGREYGKDVIEKAVLLRVGAHWWLRGRYGMASLAHGLLKPEQAMRSNDLMFGLFMPKDRPRPVGQFDETSGDVSPGYERRHYYTWAVERRELYKNTSFKTFDESSEQVVGSEASHFW